MTVEMIEVNSLQDIETASKGDLLNTSKVYEILIQRALTGKATISKAYSLFHSYSFSNAMLAAIQLEARGLDVTPIGTYNKWKSLGKQVSKGSKALTILYPKFGTFFADDEVENKDGTITKKRVKVHYIKGFEVHREHFALSQCNEYKQDTEQRIKLNIDWDRVLNELDIKQINWDTISGNSQGYCYPMDRSLAINPLCSTKAKTMVHEIAHILLHGKDKEFVENDVLERNIKEVQAELVAYLVMSMLGVTNEDVLSESRGYIQNWLGKDTIDPSETKAVMKATDKILSVITNKPKKEYKRED